MSVHVLPNLKLVKIILLWPVSLMGYLRFAIDHMHLLAVWFHYVFVPVYDKWAFISSIAWKLVASVGNGFVYGNNVILLFWNTYYVCKPFSLTFEFHYFTSHLLTFSLCWILVLFSIFCWYSLMNAFESVVDVIYGVIKDSIISWHITFVVSMGT